MSFHRKSSSIGGKTKAPRQTPASCSYLSCATGLEAGRTQREAHVAGLPCEQREMDDGDREHEHGQVDERELARARGRCRTARPCARSNPPSTTPIAAPGERWAVQVIEPGRRRGSSAATSTSPIAALIAPSTPAKTAPTRITSGETISDARARDRERPRLRSAVASTASGVPTASPRRDARSAPRTRSRR